MKSERKCYIDLETSGLKIPPAVILAIGAITSDGDEFLQLVTPTQKEWDKAAPEALKVNGLTIERLKEDGLPLADARDLFLSWLVEHDVVKGKCGLVMQNPTFDIGFLSAAMGSELDFIGFPFFDTTDVRSMFSKVVNRNLVKPATWPNGSPKRDGHSISRALGVEEEPEVHDALEGAKVVKRNYDACLDLLDE